MREWWNRSWRGLAALVQRHPRTVAATGGGVVAAVSAAVALLLSSAPAPATPTASASARASTATIPGSPVSPFTGEPVAAFGPVVAVKIDNIVNARPQAGLQDADIVYVLPVEGGLSRFLAVFSSRLPPVHRAGAQRA